MSTKFKALSLGLLALLATAGFAVVNASATVSGHFEHDAATNHATIVGQETVSPHDLVFTDEVSGSAFTCEHATYHGTAPAKTVTSVTVTPTYKTCKTVGGAHGAVTVHVNGCGFTLESHGANTHGTVHVECPAGKAIEITHPNCTITVPAQTLNGMTYTQKTENGKHTLTVDVTVKQITGHYHGGICIFLGTVRKFSMTGALTVEAQNTAGERVNVTHT
ncbi:MAG TPA: hypothetical protein VF729_02110 [Solirubrobacterales bacterium]